MVILKSMYEMSTRVAVRALRQAQGTDTQYPRAFRTPSKSDVREAILPPGEG